MVNHVYECRLSSALNRYHFPPLPAITFCALIWFDLIWFDLIWFGLVWFVTQPKPLPQPFFPSVVSIQSQSSLSSIRTFLSIRQLEFIKNGRGESKHQQRRNQHDSVDDHQQQQQRQQRQQRTSQQQSDHRLQCPRHDQTRQTISSSTSPNRGWSWPFDFWSYCWWMAHHRWQHSSMRVDMHRVHLQCRSSMSQPDWI